MSAPVVVGGARQQVVVVLTLAPGVDLNDGDVVGLANTIYGCRRDMVSEVVALPPDGEAMRVNLWTYQATEDAGNYDGGVCLPCVDDECGGCYGGPCGCECEGVHA